jgi:hypothetical protein
VVAGRPDDKVTREGTDRVAGHECVVWRIEAKKEDPDDEAEAKRACVTADGVPLRVVEEKGEERSTTVATRVEYARQDPAQSACPRATALRSERVRSATALRAARRVAWPRPTATHPEDDVARGQQGAGLDPVGGLEAHQHRLALARVAQRVELPVSLVQRLAST